MPVRRAGRQRSTTWDRTERLTLACQVKRLGQSGGPMRIVDGDAVTLLDRPPILTATKRARAFLE
jgi:hypothetical protein